jgi:hypothetical protein
MARAKACAKCQRETVAVISSANVGIGFAAGAASQIRLGFMSTCPIKLHVCTFCGFVEQWAVTEAPAFAKLRERFEAQIAKLAARQPPGASP